MAKKPDIEADIDTGPLTREQLRGLARDQIAALRNTMKALGQHQDVNCLYYGLLNRLEVALTEE